MLSAQACTDEDISRVAHKLGKMWNGIESFRRPPTNGSVLIDLTVGSWHYVVTKLLIAKYVSYYYNAKLIAVLPDASAQSHLISSLAEAFSVGELVDLRSTITHVWKSWPNFENHVSGLVQDWPTEGKELRIRLSHMPVNGVPIGDLIYDTYLRSLGAPTLRSLDSRLLNLIADAVVRQRTAEILFERYDVKTVISGHMVYNYFGIFSRTALARGIPVIQDISQNPFRLKHFRDFTMARQSTSQFQLREFNKIFASERETAVAFGRRYCEERISGQRELVLNDLVYGAYGATRQRLTKEELCGQLGWSAEKPIVALMSHVLFESPHTVGGALFNDIYEWLEETILLARQMPEVQFLIKPHPDQRYYDEQSRHSSQHVPGDEAIRTLVEQHKTADGGLPNVAFCPPSLHTGSLVDIVSAIVTQHGTAGYEMGAWGIPVILIGKAPYSRLGFTIEPKSMTEYADVLRNAGNIPRLTEEQRERVFTFIYMLFEKGRSKSNLLPEYNRRGSWAPAEFPELIHGIEERIDRFDIDTEPLYYDIDAMLRGGFSSLNMA